MLLLTTRLTVPQTRQALVHRLPLIARLNPVEQHKLTLISAPAGYGKTTLVCAWLHDCTLPIAWLSLDADDNDPVHFWRYFIAALRTLQPACGEHALTLLQSLQLPELESILIPLLNDISVFPHHFVLVLDDYHLVETEAVHRSLAFLLTHLPAKMHLVMISRTDPPFPLARLRSRSELVELHASDLLFTPDEASVFLRDVMKLDLSGDDVALLEERSEGWVAGLQLAALSLQGRKERASTFIQAFTGRDRHVLDYLLEEVLQRQPASIQTILLQTSILERFSGSLCNVVCDRDDGESILVTLERANLFLVPLDNERRWYRYHHLFAELLRYRLQQLTPQQIPDLHRKAAAWYEKQGMVSEAISHTLMAQDFAWTARLLKQVAETMIMQGEAITILGWLKKVPRTIMRSYAILSLIYALALLATSQFDAAEAHIQDVESALSDGQAEIASDDSDDSYQSIAGRMEAIRSTIAINFGDVPRTIETAQRALVLLPEHDWLIRGLATLNLGDAYEEHGDFSAAERYFADSIALNKKSGNNLVAVTTMGSMATLLAIQGHLRRAAQIYQDALMLANASAKQGGLPSAGKSHVFLAGLFYEWNDLERALYHVTEGIQLCKIWGHVNHQVDGYLYLAKIKQAYGDLESACAVLQTAKQLVDDELVKFQRTKLPAHNYRLVALLDHIAVAQAELWLEQGNLDAAARLIQERKLRADDVAPGRDHLLLAKLFLAQGHAEQALKQLRRLHEAAETKNEVQRAVHIEVLCSLAYHAHGATAQAITTLVHALAFAEAEGYIRSFIDAGPPLLTLLQQVASHSLLTGYVNRLLQAFAKVPSTTSSNLIEALTEREIDVLRLLANGMSNREIANSLVVTVGTVKWYVNSIYGKLNAHSRIQAVKRAKELHLLPPS